MSLYEDLNVKKSAFTLSEILVTLAIIGIVGAILAPVFGKIMPDKDKMIVLKTAKILTDINYELLNNNVYYWTPRGSACVGFNCTQRPLDPVIAAGIGAPEEKYPILLASKLHIKETLQDGFITQDNMEWRFIDGDFNLNDSVVLQIDTNLDNGTSTVFGGTDKVDTFRFRIDIRGNVFGEDNLTQVYLANPHKFNDRKADYAVAEAKTSE